MLTLFRLISGLISGLRRGIRPETRKRGAANAPQPGLYRTFFGEEMGRKIEQRMMPILEFVAVLHRIRSGGSSGGDPLAELQRAVRLGVAAIEATIAELRADSSWMKRAFAPRAGDGTPDLRRASEVSQPVPAILDALMMPPPPPRGAAAELAKWCPRLASPEARAAIDECFEQLSDARFEFIGFMLDQWTLRYLSSFLGESAASRLTAAWAPVGRLALRAAHSGLAADPDRLFQRLMALEAAQSAALVVLDSVLTDPKLEGERVHHYLARIESGLRTTGELRVPSLISAPVRPDNIDSIAWLRPWMSANPQSGVEFRRVVDACFEQDCRVYRRFLILMVELRLRLDFPREIAAELAPLWDDAFRVGGMVDLAAKRCDGDALLRATTEFEAVQQEISAGVADIARRPESREAFSEMTKRVGRPTHGSPIPLAPPPLCLQATGAAWVNEWGRENPQGLEELKRANRAAIEANQTAMLYLNGMFR